MPCPLFAYPIKKSPQLRGLFSYRQTQFRTYTYVGPYCLFASRIFAICLGDIFLLDGRIYHHLVPYHFLESTLARQIAILIVGV